MTAAFVVLAAVVLVAGIVLAIRWHSPDLTPNRITPPARRILFPFIGHSISQPTLDAALRLARAEGATLVPAYVMTVPLHLDLEAPTPERCGEAMPLLDLIEQRAARLKVPVDSRIEVGRTARHALHELIQAESFDRIVVPAATNSSEGFAGEDIGWLLEHAPGEIIVLRPQNGSGNGGYPLGRRSAEVPSQSESSPPSGSHTSPRQLVRS